MVIGGHHIPVGVLVVIGLVLLVIIVFVTAPGPNGRTSSPAPTKAPQTYPNYRVQQLTALLVREMAKAGNPGLRQVSLNRIEENRGHAANWGYSLPTVGIALKRGVWQREVTGCQEAGDWMSPSWHEVIVTPAGEWAIIGNGFRTMYAKGENRDIGQPFVMQSTHGAQAVSVATFNALAQGIEKVLHDHRPGALPEFYALRDA